MRICRVCLSIGKILSNTDARILTFYTLYDILESKEYLRMNGGAIMTINELKQRILTAIQGYPVKSMILFGSRAAGTNREDSDVDLIVEFSQPVTLLTLTGLQLKLEDALKLDVDLVHGPIQPTDLLEIGKEVVLYAA